MTPPEYWKQEALRLSATNPLLSLFAMGHYHLFLDNATGCINTYSIAVDSILNNATQNGIAAIASEIILLQKFQLTKPTLIDQIIFYLNLAMCLIEDLPDKEPYLNFLELHRNRKEPFKKPVIIVAGGASLMDKTETETYRDYLRKMMHGFTGTIISGGTTAGIPGLVGEVKLELEKKSALDFSLIAYLPRELPANATKSIAYDSFHETDSNHFSVLEILSYWCDLVCSGIHPSNVILIGINGGDISAMEYRIALSLGAKVGILANSGRAVSDLLQDKTWKNHHNLYKIPEDSPTIRAFVIQFTKN